MNVKDLKLDIEEKAWLESVENGEWQSTGDVEEVENKFKKAILAYRNQKQKVCVSLNTNDLYKIKRMSTENGFTIDTLINALVHNYVNGKISLQL